MNDLALPDVASALCSKAHACAGRLTPRDAVDLWRLSEAAAAAQITETTRPTGPTATAAVELLRKHLGRPGAQGAAQASARSVDRTRMRALALQVVGPSGS